MPSRKPITQILNKHSIQLFEDSNRGAVALTLMDPILRELESHINARMVNDYRSGKLTSEACFGLIGELSVLRTLRATLEGKVQVGRAAAIEEAGNV